MIFCTMVLDTTKYVVGDDITMEDVYSINTGNLYGAIIGKDGAVHLPQSDVVKQSSSEVTIPVTTEEVESESVYEYPYYEVI